MSVMCDDAGLMHTHTGRILEEEPFSSILCSFSQEAVNSLQVDSTGVRRVQVKG